MPNNTKGGKEQMICCKYNLLAILINPWYTIQESPKLFALGPLLLALMSVHVLSESGRGAAAAAQAVFSACRKREMLHVACEKSGNLFWKNRFCGLKMVQLECPRARVIYPLVSFTFGFSGRCPFSACRKKLRLIKWNWTFLTSWHQLCLQNPVIWIPKGFSPKVCQIQTLSPIQLYNYLLT